MPSETSQKTCKTQSKNRPFEESGRNTKCYHKKTVCGMRRNGKLLWASLVLVGANLTSAGAQTLEGDSIGEITVKARKMMSNMTAASPLQVMDRSRMEKIGAHDVADAVRYFSGVSVKDYGGIGGLKTVSVRSLGAQHTGVCYDGVAISDCQSGQIDISRFSLDNVSLLYLTIGQSDDIYQSAKLFASAGTLHIETLRPQSDGKKWQAAARLKAGSFGTVNPSFMYTLQPGRKTYLSAYADFLRADGNYPFRLWNGEHRIDEKRNNSDIRSWRAELNAHTALTDRQELSAKLYLFDSERGLPGGVIYDNTYSAERLYDRNYFGQIAYENRFSDKWKLKAAGKFNYSWNRDYNEPASGVTDDRFKQTETYLTATFRGEPVRNLAFSLAQDFAYNDLSTTLRNCQYPERFSWLTALALRYALPHFTATASLLNTHITERVKTGEASDGFKRLSPAFSLSWKPWNENLRFRLSYKDIFRVPTFNDLYYLLIGNANLRPESTRQWNFGLTWNRSFSTLLEYVGLSADAYYGSVKDKIVAVPTMFIWKMSNIGKVETLGADINMQVNLRWATGWSNSLQLSYNYMQAEDVTDRSSKVWRNQIAYTPHHSGAANCTLSTPWADLSYSLFYASERYISSYNSAENRIPPYTDHGITLSRTFAWKARQLRIQLDALNLGNKNYEIVRFYPMPGRNYKVTLNYQF